MDHQFMPLSGSQDTGGRYTRCSVLGCTRGPDQHTTAAQPRPEGAPALTDTDIAWYRENHTAASVKLHDGSAGLECTYCEDSDWPCSILNMVEEIVAIRAELDAERRARAAAEAEVGRLRAALEVVRPEHRYGGWQSTRDGYRVWCPCGWEHENTSPSLARAAVDAHLLAATTPPDHQPAAGQGGT